MPRPLPDQAVMPSCPRPGHVKGPGGFVVRLDGHYGKAVRRQRYTCVAPDGSRHRFTEELPREATIGGVYTERDSPVAAHAGPVVSRQYAHRLDLVADALVAVGGGVSYARASQQARVAAGRDPLAGGGAGQLVAEWVDAWAPTVITALTDTRPAQTLVLDDTDFCWTNRRTQQVRREFAVLVAYAYYDDDTGRVLGVRASPTANHEDYLALLDTLHLAAPPISVVSDGARAITAAVNRYWPPGTPGAPVVFTCEHHPRQRAPQAPHVDKADQPRGRWVTSPNAAFQIPEGWVEFRPVCAQLGADVAGVDANDATLSAQVAARADLPAHYSTASAEAAIRRLRSMFEQRSFALRNARRTNLLLGLAGLHLNDQDDPATYRRLLREACVPGRGHAPARQRTNRDPVDFNPTTKTRIHHYSLRIDPIGDPASCVARWA